MRIIVTLVPLMALSACGGGGGDAAAVVANNPPPVISPVVASMVVDSAGGTLAVTDASSPLAGTQVTIPAGALASPTKLTIAQVAGMAGVPANVAVARVGPSGIVFSSPVTITLPYSLQYMADNSSEADVHMSGDAEFSYRMYAEFYSPYVAGEHRFHIHTIVPAMPGPVTTRPP